MTTRSTALGAGAASIEAAKTLIGEIELPGEDKQMLLEYLTQDPDQRMPSESFSKEIKLLALKYLSKLMKKLREETLLTIVDQMDPSFLNEVSRCKSFFPSNNSIHTLYKDLLVNAKYNVKYEHAHLQVYQEYVVKLKEMELQMPDLELVVKDFQHLVEKVHTRYKKFQKKRRALNTHFSLA